MKDEKRVVVNHDTGESTVTHHFENGVVRVAMEDGQPVRVTGSVSLSAKEAAKVLPPSIYATGDDANP
jgi:hypothetical protein